jgi:serine/threonine protein kinase
VSKQLKSEKEKMYEQCGTPAYVAPEVIGQKGYRGFKADMWSAGVCLYVMLLGTVPFRSNTMEELHKLILKGRFDFQGEKLSNEAKDLICGLIQVNYRKRLTAKQALDHPWLQSVQDGTDPIDINRPDLADVIFTENEKQNIKNHYLCRLEKLKKKRFNQRKKIIHQNSAYGPA